MEKLKFPNRITVEVTNNCNVSCKFCNRQKICMDIGYMSKQLFYKIVDEASLYLPVKMVPFFRGEPLMHPDIIDFLFYAKQKGIGPIQIASNALLLDEEMQDKLIETEIDYISFSLDTMDEELYRSSRVMGDLRVSSDHVRQFCEKCKKRRKKELFAPTIQVSTINLKEYIPMQRRFIDFWGQYADVVRIYEEHDERGRLVDSELRKKLDVFHERKPCRKVFTDMIIYWDGRLALCNYDWDEQREIGNVNNTTLYEAWNSPAYEEIREQHISNLFEDEICSECHHWKIDYMDKGYLGQSYVSQKEEVRK